MTKSVASMGFLAIALALSGCNKPSAEQVIEAIKKDPKILIEAAKKDPNAFREALQAAQEHMQRERAKEEAQDQEKYFKNPLKPKLGSDQVFIGSSNAKVTIVEYTDFECPYCARGFKAMEDILKKYEGKVRVTVKHLPLPFHPKAKPAAQYYEAIRLQNPEAAFAFYEAIFKNQDTLKEQGEPFLKSVAKQYQVDMKRLAKDLNSDKVNKKIEADMNEAREFGFRGTPSFLVGGVPVKGAQPPEEFAKVIDRLL